MEKNGFWETNNLIATLEKTETLNWLLFETIKLELKHEKKIYFEQEALAFLEIEGFSKF